LLVYSIICVAVAGSWGLEELSGGGGEVRRRQKRMRSKLEDQDGESVIWIQGGRKRVN
jgi:hypothetical protein